jgi:hypothetical protein
VSDHITMGDRVALLVRRRLSEMRTDEDAPLPLVVESAPLDEGWTAPINLPSIDSLQLRSLGRGTHPKVLERRVKDISAHLAKGMSAERAVIQWFNDNGDRLPGDYPKSPRGTDVQLKFLADALHKQLTGIAVGLLKQGLDEATTTVSVGKTLSRPVRMGDKEYPAGTELAEVTSLSETLVAVKFADGSGTCLARHMVA